MIIFNQVSADENWLLNEVTDKLIEDTKKVMEISPHMKKTFKAVADNLSILKWLNKHLKGEDLFF